MSGYCTWEADRSRLPATLASPAEPPIGSVWRHVRQDNDYIVLDVCQDATNCLDSRRRLVIYSDVRTGVSWARKITEFLDGRFVRREQSP